MRLYVGWCESTFDFGAVGVRCEGSVAGSEGEVGTLDGWDLEGVGCGCVVNVICLTGEEKTIDAVERD